MGTEAVDPELLDEPPGSVTAHELRNNKDAKKT
jgi:hypothetical protein